MLSKKAQAIDGALCAWVSTLPFDTVTLTRQEIPDSDDYGLELVLALQPTRKDGCPLELGITGPEEGSTVYISVDTLHRVAERTGFRIRRRKEEIDYIALYVEPISISVQQLLDLCNAASRGDVILRVGAVGGYVLCTAGYIDLPVGRFEMHGTGGCFGLLKCASRFGLAEIRNVKYEPWTDS